MWTLYDRLISTVDDSVKIKDFVVGPQWTAVITEDDCVGLAWTVSEKFRRFEFDVKPEAGMSAAEIAAGIKSWNYHESALGLAAINAFHNRAENLPSDAEIIPGGRRSQSAFIKFCEKNTKNKRSVMIEPHYLREELSSAPGVIDIVRKEPTYRDYLYQAYEELIPKADQLILSGITLVDKLGSPALRLAENKTSVFWGPDVPLTSAFGEFGVSQVTGFIVDDPEKCMWLAKSSAVRDDMLNTGHFVTVIL